MKKLKAIGEKLLAGKKKYIVIGILIVVIGMAMSQGGASIEVQGSAVDVGSVQRYVEEVGEFTAKNSITLNGRVSGIVDTIYKIEGDPVKAGDTIMVLDQEDMKIQIQGTEAEIDAVYAELAEAGRMDGNLVAQLKSKIALAQNTYVKNKETYETNEALYNSGAISKQDRDNYKRDYEDSLQNLRIAQNDLTLITKGISESLRKQYDSRINVLMAKLELEKRQLEQMEIKAPIDGIVTDKFVKVGDAISFGTALVEVSDPDNYHITSDLLVSDAGNAKIGYKVIISDPETDSQWQGVIAKIYPKAFSKLSDLGIEQKRVKVEIEPLEMTFDRFGYEFDLKIIFEEKENILRCKDSAVFEVDGLSYVFKAIDGRAMLAPVTTGLEGEEYVEIVSGLSEGDKIIQTPGNDLEEGMKVILK